MSMTRINSPVPAVTVRYVDLPLGTALSGNVGYVEAPTVIGYTFLCWAQCVTIGWVGLAYVNPASEPTAFVWVPQSTAAGAAKDCSVKCCAMYVKA